MKIFCSIFSCWGSWLNFRHSYMSSSYGCPVPLTVCCLLATLKCFIFYGYPIMVVLEWLSFLSWLFSSAVDFLFPVIAALSGRLLPEPTGSGCPELSCRDIVTDLWLLPLWLLLLSDAILIPALLCSSYPSSPSMTLSCQTCQIGLFLAVLLWLSSFVLAILKYVHQIIT